MRRRAGSEKTSGKTSTPKGGSSRQRAARAGRSTEKGGGGTSARRERMKETLKKRTEESESRKDDKGMRRPYFKKDLKDVIFWENKAGDHIIDIIPYMSGENDPHNEKGEDVYVLDLWVHRNCIGPNEDSYVCLTKNYDEPCPACEYMADMKRSEDYDQDEYDALDPKRRCVYNIVCYDSEKEEQKGVQVLEIAHWYMENNLVGLARNKRTGEKYPFSHPDTGKSISFTSDESSFTPKGSEKSFTVLKLVNHALEERNYQISDEILDAAHCLDDLIHVASYEDFYEVFHGESIEEEQEDEERETGGSRRGRRQQHQEEETGSEDNIPEGNECEGVFGEDLDQLEHCHDCNIYDKCATEADRLEEERKKKASAGGRRRGKNRS